MKTTWVSELEKTKGNPTKLIKHRNEIHGNRFQNNIKTNKYLKSLMRQELYSILYVKEDHRRTYDLRISMALFSN